MARIGVVIHRPTRNRLFAEEDQRRLEGLGEVVWTDSDTPLTYDEAISLLADCEVGIGSWQTPFPTAELVAGCPGLRLWEHAAGTVKHMFGSYTPASLTIASCKTAIAQCVAEITLAWTIVGLRGVLPNAAANRLGITRAPERVRVLYGSTIGIVGASEVGKRVMRLLAPLGCRLLLYDPYCTAESARDMGAELIDNLTELCERSDVVSLHAPDIEACRHMIGVVQFAAMRDDAVFINTARGRCVDEAALIAELEKGRLFAFLDVTDPEPAAADSPLRTLPNVILNSHIAGPQSFNIGHQAVDDVAAFLRGKSPLCVVTAEQLDRTA